MTMFAMNYHAINASICSVRTDEQFEGIQPEEKETVIQKIVRYYRGLAPFLIYVFGLSVWPAKWRLVLTGFLQALNDLSAIVPPSEASPAMESAASDTTTTNPTSSDPSFKAGKDL
jgi:hypothetical protein